MRTFLRLLPLILLPACSSISPKGREAHLATEPVSVSPAFGEVNPKWKPFEAYYQNMVTRIQAEFDHLNEVSRVYPPPGSIVIVRFILNDEGNAIRILSVDNKATAAAARLCVNAVSQPSPYGVWTDEMKSALGKEQELTFEFYYK